MMVGGRRGQPGRSVPVLSHEEDDTCMCQMRRRIRCQCQCGQVPVPGKCLRLTDTWPGSEARESVLFIGTRFSNLYTAVWGTLEHCLRHIDPQCVMLSKWFY